MSAPELDPGSIVFSKSVTIQSEGGAVAHTFKAVKNHEFLSIVIGTHLTTEKATADPLTYEKIQGMMHQTGLATFDEIESFFGPGRTSQFIAYITKEKTENETHHQNPV